MFPTEVSIVTVDPQKVAQQEQSAKKSFAFSEWIKLLNMYKHNQEWGKVDDCIETMNRRFLVRQSFWVKELEQHSNRLDYQNPIHVSAVWQLIKGGFENEYCMRQLGTKLADWVCLAKEKKALGLTQAELKLEWLAERFKWDIQQGAVYFEKLRSIYQQKDTGKIRQAYHREFRLPFVTNDVIFDEYREWETDPQQLQRADGFYQKSKTSTDNFIQWVENKEFQKLPTDLALILMHQSSQYADSDYVVAINRQPNCHRRVQLLRTQAKQGRLQLTYLHEFQKYGSPTDDYLSQQYNIYIDKMLISYSFSKTEVVIKQYLVSLVRRFNKHLVEAQDQGYLDQWGVKVSHFRTQITRFISKGDKRVQLNLYRYWAQVETFVVKDLSTVIDLYQRLIKLKESRYETYVDYANALVSLGDISKALKVMNRSLLNSFEKEVPKKKLLEMLDLFGNIESSEGLLQEQQAESKQGEHQTQNTSPKPPIDSLGATLKRQRNFEMDPISSKIDRLQKQRHHVDSGKTVFIQNIPEEWRNAEIMNLFEDPQEIVDVRIQDTHKKRNTEGAYKVTQVCYVDMTSIEAAEKAVKNNSRKDIVMHVSKPPRQEDADQRTIFFAGLHAEVNDEDLAQFLREYQGLEDIRLIRDEHGSRGFAYIQFLTLEDRTTAWQSLFNTRKLTLKGKKFIISQCDRNRAKSKGASTVVFLEGLSYKARQSDIEGFFQKQGIDNIKQVTIPKNDQNKSKGFAYVQFGSFSDYQKALDLQRGMVFGRYFKIKKSDRQITHRKQKESSSKSNDDFKKFFS